MGEARRPTGARTPAAPSTALRPPTIDLRDDPLALLPARPAPKPPRRPARPIVDDAGPPAPGAWSPEALQAWGLSIALHLVLLIVLAFWVFRPQESAIPAISTGLGAGTPFGSEEGLEPAGGFHDVLPMPSGAITLVDPAQLGRLDDGAIAFAPTPPDAAGRLGGAPGSGGGGGFGLARFGAGGETIQGVEVKVGDPQFTLIWDTDADLDLHVVEPGGAPLGRGDDLFDIAPKHIFWMHRRGDGGGELDVDDNDGRGPENVFYKQGLGPPGEYTWLVSYYGHGPTLDARPRPTKWKVRVKHNGRVDVYEGTLKSFGQASKTFTLKVGRGGEAGEIKGLP